MLRVQDFAENIKEKWCQKIIFSVFTKKLPQIILTKNKNYEIIEEKNK